MLDDAEDFGRALVTPRRLDAWLGLSPREGKAAPSRTIETAPRPKVETPLLPKIEEPAQKIEPEIEDAGKAGPGAAG